MPYNRVVINGYLSGGAERWSCGINYGAPGETLADDAASLNAWAADVATYFDGLSSSNAAIAWLSSNAAITDIDTYYYPGFGAAGAAGSAVLASPQAGGGTQTMPNQVTRVVTLLTGLAGRRYRGRFYWPSLTGTISAGGQVVQTQGAADDWALVLNALGNWPPDVGPLSPVVVSRVGSLITPVSMVSIGNVLDTQRRRTDSLVETRVVAAV